MFTRYSTIPAWKQMRQFLSLSLHLFFFCPYFRWCCCYTSSAKRLQTTNQRTYYIYLLPTAHKHNAINHDTKIDPTSLTIPHRRQWRRQRRTSRPTSARHPSSQPIRRRSFTRSTSTRKGHRFWDVLPGWWWWVKVPLQNQLPSVEFPSELPMPKNEPEPTICFHRSTTKPSWVRRKFEL